jgi:hypothetical protein
VWQHKALGRTIRAGEGELGVTRTRFGQEVDMSEVEQIVSYLMETIGEDACGSVCCAPEVFRDQDGWKLRMEGFMEPWKIGATVDEAKTTIKELASMRFGLWK